MVKTSCQLKSIYLDTSNSAVAVCRVKKAVEEALAEQRRVKDEDARKKAAKAAARRPVSVKRPPLLSCEQPRLPLAALRPYSRTKPSSQPPLELLLRLLLLLCFRDLWSGFGCERGQPAKSLVPPRSTLREAAMLQMIPILSSIQSASVLISTVPSIQAVAASTG